MEYRNTPLDAPLLEETPIVKKKSLFLQIFNFCFAYIVLGAILFNTGSIFPYFLIPSIYLFPIFLLLNLLIPLWNDHDLKISYKKFITVLSVFLFLLIEGFLIFIAIFMIAISGFEGLGSN